MTTIAWCRGMLAADSSLTCGGWRLAEGGAKIRAFSRGRYAAICGDLALFEPFLGWLAGVDPKSPAPAPELDDETSIIVPLGPSSVRVYSRGGWYTSHAAFAAWGSGMPAALAAMHMGADARRAVEIAALVDPETAGPVVSIEVETVAA